MAFGTRRKGAIMRSADNQGNRGRVVVEMPRTQAIRVRELRASDRTVSALGLGRTGFVTVALCLLAAAGATAAEPLAFTIKVDTILEHDDGKFLWYHPRV